MSEEKPKIACLPNGPYYLLNDMNPKVVPNLQDAEGNACATVSGIALCRCGGSANKPFCDGTHGRNGFSDENQADGSLDKRMNYAGRKVTIHDNRSICAHAGFCTDRLSTVFRLKQEPWIDPDGATAEEIIAVVQQCPSGALSYSIDDKEHRDQERPPMVTVTNNGPYAITGGVELLGHEVGEGGSNEHYTLCRCGASRNKPFCDGSHWSTGFTDGTD